MSASQSQSHTNSTTTTQDQRAAIGGNGTIISLPGGNVKNITLTDGGVVSAALDAVQNVATGAVQAAQGLAQGSNQIAAQVADSQRAFVDTASGQKTFLWGAAILAAIALLGKK